MSGYLERKAKQIIWFLRIEFKPGLRGYKRFGKWIQSRKGLCASQRNISKNMPSSSPHFWILTLVEARTLETIKLWGQKETLLASSYRRCQKGMTGSEKVLIIFVITCFVITLLSAKGSKRCGNPHGARGLEVQLGKVGSREAGQWTKALSSGSRGSHFLISSPVKFNVQLGHEERILSILPWVPCVGLTVE